MNTTYVVRVLNINYKLEEYEYIFYKDAMEAADLLRRANDLLSVVVERRTNLKTYNCVTGDEEKEEKEKEKEEKDVCDNCEHNKYCNLRKIKKIFQ